MKPTSRNLEQHCDTKRKTLLNLSFSFCLRAICALCLAFCFLASVSSAEIATEQLDPTDLLMSHSAKTSKDVNMPNIKSHPPAIKPLAEPAMQVVVLPSDRQEQAQTNPDFLKIAPVNFAARIDEKSSKDNFIIAPNPQSLLTRQLWKQRITFAEDENDQRSKNELRRIIEQIRSVEFDPQSETIEPAVLTELVSAAKPGETLPDSNLLNESKYEDIESDGQGTSGGFSNAKKDMQSAGPLPRRTVTDQTLQILKHISQHPEQLSNPFELAEVLFLSGHLKEALACYQEALKRREPHDARSAQERAWILFQVANCLRDIDRPLAMKTYRQLITEYPDSPWTELAKAQDKLVDWFDKDKPVSLITQANLRPNDGKSNMEYAAGE
jgi:tetratricopeptide (TPR) repeat protein